MDEERCGNPTVGERGGFPMCGIHFGLFSPEDPDA